jgi:hypothetical protein
MAFHACTSSWIARGGGTEYPPSTPMVRSAIKVIPSRQDHHLELAELFPRQHHLVRLLRKEGSVFSLYSPRIN